MHDNHIQYVEFQSDNLEKTKHFYSKVFGWTFTDYGSEYTAFDNSGVMGGFAKSEAVMKGGPLVVLYHSNLESARAHVIDEGSTLTRDIFSFPGGRRFQFLDPSGNELAVWSDA